MFTLILMLMSGAGSAVFASNALQPKQPPAPVDRFSVPTPLERAKDLVKTNNPAEALEALSSYRPSREEFSAYYAAYARALVQLNQPYDSIEHFRRAFIYAPTEGEKEQLLLERAEVYSSMTYYSEAAVCFEVFLQKFPRSNAAGRAELGIAEARFHLNEFRTALAHFEKAGSSVKALSGKANSLQALGRKEEAHEIYRALIENNPEAVNASKETLFHLGENYWQQGKKGEAKVYLSAIKEEPFKSRAALSLGIIAMEENSMDTALRNFTFAAESPERLVRREALMKRAEMLVRTNKLTDAEAALQEIKDGYPYGKTYDNAILLLSRVYRKQGKFPEATALLKGMIYRRTPVIAALNELESILLDAKDRDPERFVKLWETSGAWLMDPSRAEVVGKLAQGLRYTGKPFIAVCIWLIRYGNDEAKSEARLRLADFYAGVGDVDIAASYLTRARIKKHNDDALRVAARIHAGKQEAVKASEKIMAIRATREEDVMALLELIPELKKPEKAFAFSSQYFAKAEASPRAFIYYADLLHDSGKKEAALAQYRRAVTVQKAKAAKDKTMPADVEWAHYRISTLGDAEEAAASRKELQASPQAIGRIAAAELKVITQRKRIE